MGRIDRGSHKAHVDAFFAEAPDLGPGFGMSENRHKQVYALNRLTGLQVSDAQSATLNSFSYQLNAVGHRTRIDEATGRTRYYAYDWANRGRS